MFRPDGFDTPGDEGKHTGQGAPPDQVVEQSSAGDPLPLEVDNEAKSVANPHHSIFIIIDPSLFLMKNSPLSDINP